MNYLAELKARFQPVVAALSADPEPLLEMIRPAQDPRLGDYQANFAMPLCKQLGRGAEGPQVAQEILDQTDLEGLCDEASVAGPGFINMRIAPDRLNRDINAIVNDKRLGVPVAAKPKTVVIDFSSPNIAKPMHVGHIRSTVIGDSISRTLRFMGHQVVTDNHIGDWGTQFGMILYGYKNFLDESAFDVAPVNELSRLYRLVNQLVGYQEAVAGLPEKERTLAALEGELEAAAAEEAEGGKKAKKKRKQLEKRVASAAKAVNDTRGTIDKIAKDAELSSLAQSCPDIGRDVLAETAKLHDGDAKNRALWEKFLPSCRDEMQKIYQRLNVGFDHELGESFYHGQLADVVKRFTEQGYAEVSEGAVCVFLDGFESPMIIQKKDGAFLYATTDLATIEYRVKRWNPDEILYVVDFRQSDHFEKLFAAASLTGHSAKLMHVKFGTVTDENGKPFKTRDGAVGLEWLLDLAVQGALKVINESNNDKRDADIESIEQKAIAETVGHAAVKYFDLSHNRESDYEFDPKRMVANEGNTATYMQYSYARISSILRKSGLDIAALRKNGAIQLVKPEERALALEVLQLEHVIEECLSDYRPNILTAYVHNLAAKFSTFFETCHVNKSKEPTKSSRLLLCDIVGRSIETVLSLLGIQVVKRM